MGGHILLHLPVDHLKPKLNRTGAVTGVFTKGSSCFLTSSGTSHSTPDLLITPLTQSHSHKRSKPTPLKSHNNKPQILSSNSLLPSLYIIPMHNPPQQPRIHIIIILTTSPSPKPAMTRNQTPHPSQLLAPHRQQPSPAKTQRSRLKAGMQGAPRTTRVQLLAPTDPVELR